MVKKIPDGIFTDWKDGEVITASEYKREREILKVAVNDTIDKTQYAEEQGDYAKAQGEYALVQGQQAENLIETAVPIVEEAEEAILDIREVLPDVKGLGNAGAYNNNTQYQKNNIVSSAGSSFQAKKATKGNPPPVLPQAENEWWNLIGRKGDDGTGTVFVHRDEFIAEAGQKTFNLTNEYDQFQNRLRVTVGGVPQFSPENFTETTSQSFTIPSGVPTGVKVIAEYFGNAVPAADDIGTTVHNHTQVISNHTQELQDVTSQLAHTALQKDLEIERARISNLTANAGDTDGNSELLDVRVGFDGVTYPTAGEATRAIGNYMVSENAPWEVE